MRNELDEGLDLDWRTYTASKPNGSGKKDHKHFNRQTNSSIEEIKEAIRKKLIDTLFKIIIYIIALAVGVSIAIKLIINVIW
jgi:hypothetical protein